MDNAIGVCFPGALRIVAYEGSRVVVSSEDYGRIGTGFFGRVISNEPFDLVVLQDWWDDLVYPDHIYFVIAPTTETEIPTWGKIKALF